MMFSMNRRVIIIISAISTAIIAVVLFFFNFAPSTPPEVTNAPAKEVLKQSTAVRQGEGVVGGVTPTEAPQTATEIKKEFKIEFFGSTIQLPIGLVEALTPLLPISVKTSQSLSQPNLSESRLSGQPLPADPAYTATRIPTEQEIFEIIWPKYYRDYLFDMRSLMINDGFINSNQHTVFASDADIYNFVKALDAYAFSKGWITEEDYNNFIRGVNEVLPELIEGEKKDLRFGKPFSGLKTLPGGQVFANKSKTAILRDLLDGFAYVLIRAKPAYAAWVTKGVCYKDDNPADQTPGSNLPTICCNCGFRCTNYCVFVEDCGTNGAACDTQIGCLNSVCQNRQNAIWDPQTGTCGCG